MVIIGAKGFAKEVLEILYQQKTPNIAFYDDINKDAPSMQYEEYPILKNAKDLSEYFEKFGHQYTLGIGKPASRIQLAGKINALNGILTSTISPFSIIGSFDVNIASGCNILSGVNISNSVTVGTGTMIYYNSIITHDCKVGKYVEISPNVTLLGRCKVDDFTHIGTGAIILPDITIGANVTIGAGSVVTKNIPDNSIAVGSPARIIKEVTPLTL